MPEPCTRKCHSCGNVAEHKDNIVPEVLCKKCGSQDTRLIRNPDEHHQSAAKYIKGHCLASLPLTFDEVVDLYVRAGNWTRPLYQRVCMSHERLRAELSGAEILLKEQQETIELYEAMKEGFTVRATDYENRINELEKRLAKKPA